MTTRTRLKLATIAFFAVLATAWAKHFFPGISTELTIVAVANVGAYIWADTKRPSDNGGHDGQA